MTALGVLAGSALSVHARLAPAAAGVATDVPTSFGVVAVEHVEFLAAPAAKDLAGGSHGVAGLVPEGRVLAQVSVNLTNLTGAPVAYDPERFRLRGGGDRIAPTSASLRAGTLQPGASVTGRLGFLVPRGAREVRLEVPDGARTVVVALGRPVTIAGDDHLTGGARHEPHGRGHG